MGDPTKVGIHIDKSVNLANVGGLVVALFLAAFAWFDVTDGVSDNAEKIVTDREATASKIAEVQLDYTAKIGEVKELHQTEFHKLDEDYDNLKEDMSAQAVSIGRIEEGVNYIRETIDSGD